MRILPVLDLLEGRVVRGVAGQRERYRPIESTLTAGCDPLRIAEAIRSRFGLSELYVADLDAILHGRPNLHVLRSLGEAGFTLLVDAGLRRHEDAAPLRSAGVERVVAGLETLAGPRELGRLVHEFGSAVIFSLDLKDGRPMGGAGWPQENPAAIAKAAVSAGCEEMIVLDLARVGTGKGLSTLELCAEIREACPGVKLITGGGIRGRDDLERLRKASIDAVLVASALHDGSLGPEDVGCALR